MGIKGCLAGPPVIKYCVCGEEVWPHEEYCSRLCREGGAIAAAKPVSKPAIPPPAPADTEASPPPEDPHVLPTDSQARKELPIFSGVLNYFPLALAAVARVSKRGNDKHNPGQPLHWSRDKATGHMDCLIRHAIDVETLDPVTGEYEDAQAMAWRALAKLEELEEKRLGKPMSRGSRVANTKEKK